MTLSSAQNSIQGTPAQEVYAVLLLCPSFISHFPLIKIWFPYVLVVLNTFEVQTQPFHIYWELMK